MSNTLRPCSRRIKLCQFRTNGHQHQQTRNATLLKRPKRPYTFTQLVTLTDGSTYMHRTTSPQPVYRATKDVRNSLLWNPSNQALMNVEEDDAGRLASFRGKFGTAWDAETKVETPSKEAAKTQDTGAPAVDNSGEESLLDMIAGRSKSSSVTKDDKKSGAMGGKVVKAGGKSGKR